MNGLAGAYQDWSPLNGEVFLCPQVGSWSRGGFPQLPIHTVWKSQEQRGTGESLHHPGER